MRVNSNANRRGFTLVELLVVIAIIGLLIAMMLPAIQASREAANRTACMNQMTQLGTSIHNYEMAHGWFPPGTIDKQGPVRSVPKGDHRNWIVHLLPHLGETNVYRNIDQTVGVYDPKNAPVRATLLPPLVCPTDPSWGTTPPASSYAAVHHDLEAPIDADNNGTFFLNSRLRYDDISDGTGHTIFLGEKPQESGDLGWISGTRATLRNTGAPLNAHQAILPLGMPIDEDLSIEDPLADAAADAPAAEDSATTQTPPAQPPADTPAPTGGDPALMVGGFGSFHAAGVNFVFGDGSVRWIPETIDLTVLQQLANRADGKLTPAGF